MTLLIFWRLIIGDPEEPPSVEALCFIKLLYMLLTCPNEKDNSSPLGYCKTKISLFFVFSSE